jgi:sugar lactone lactonase YvrE
MRATMALVASIAGLVTPLAATSVYPLRPPDPRAVVVTSEHFPVRGDGIADDTEALQQAIDRVQETTVRGVVLLPSGRYRVSRPLHVWSGIRLIGFGAERPVILLGADTPGYQEGEGKYLVHFVSYRPAAGEPIRDANPGTFYSGLINIDIEIADGNPAAIGVRSHFAQHGMLAHVDFRVGGGRAGVEAVGNEIDRCRFFGGEYGILTRKPSPSWPFLLIDSTFEGQRIAAIRTEEAGMTIVRGHFRDAPTVVMVNPERSEELYIEDSRFERIRGPALVISEEFNARTQVNLVNVSCAEVPELVHFRLSEKTIPGRAGRFRVEQLSHGLHLRGPGDAGRVETRSSLAELPEWPAAPASDVPALPPMETWVSALDLGAVGDGETDDTDALRTAIARHRTVFLPTGRYRLTDTLALRPDTVLVALSPISTQLILADETPAFMGLGATDAPPGSSSGIRFQTPRSQGTGGPKALLETPVGGTNIVTGLGLDPGYNLRAVAAKWQAGAQSLLNDVRFHGGHGTYGADGSRPPLYNNNRTGDADPTRRWDSQYWSLWVTNGGGGTFKNIWTPSPYAAAGMYVSDTETPGRVYAMSVEHHVRNEVILRRVANWRFYALQFEEERGEGPDALPLEIDQCRNLTFANLYLYRVMTTYAPFPYGVRVSSSSDIRFRGVHVYSPSKFTFDATVADADSGATVLAREIAWLDWPGSPGLNGFSGQPAGVRGPLVKLAGGFNNADALVTDSAGNVCFVDARWHRIHRWNVAQQRLELLRDHPLEPVALSFDTEGRMLVVTRIGTVFTFDPKVPGEDIEVLAPQPASARSGGLAVVPLSRWRDSHDFLAVNAEPAAYHYEALDGRTLIPATEEFVRAGYRNSFFSTIDLIRAYGLGRARAGEIVYVADEFGQKTWGFRMAADGTLQEPRLLAEEGEGAVAVDTEGNIYVPAGRIFVYAPDGRLLDQIEVPERPTSVALGGADGRTLFIGARSSLYAVPLR